LEKNVLEPYTYLAPMMYMDYKIGEWLLRGRADADSPAVWELVMPFHIFIKFAK